MEKKSVEHEASMASSYCSTISDQIPIDFPSLPDIFDLPPLPSLPDVLPPPPPPPPPSLPPSPPMSNNNGGALELSNQAVTTMFTGNSSSFSSASSEALNDAGEEGEDQNKTNKLLKPKKNKRKGQREPRTAFFTKSKIDNLDDGYRWIKYGQKAIKNSPFPRSYYRCTTPECGVKNMVERSNSDPEYVIMTYIGTHAHPLPESSRRNQGFLPLAIGTNSSGGVPGSSSYMMGSEILVSSSFTHSMSPFSSSYMIDSGLFTSSPLSHSMSSSYTVDSELLTSFPFTHSMSSSYMMGSGLLEDMLPPQMLMKESKE